MIIIDDSDEDLVIDSKTNEEPVILKKHMKTNQNMEDIPENKIDNIQKINENKEKTNIINNNIIENEKIEKNEDNEDNKDNIIFLPVILKITPENNSIEYKNLFKNKYGLKNEIFLKLHGVKGLSLQEPEKLMLLCTYGSIPRVDKEIMAEYIEDRKNMKDPLIKSKFQEYWHFTCWASVDWWKSLIENSYFLFPDSDNISKEVLLQIKLPRAKIWINKRINENNNSNDDNWISFDENKIIFIQEEFLECENFINNFEDFESNELKIPPNWAIKIAGDNLKIFKDNDSEIDIIKNIEILNSKNIEQWTDFLSLVISKISDQKIDELLKSRIIGVGHFSNLNSLNALKSVWKIIGKDPELAYILGDKSSRGRRRSNPPKEIVFPPFSINTEDNDDKQDSSREEEINTKNSQQSSQQSSQKKNHSEEIEIPITGIKSDYKDKMKIWKKNNSYLQHELRKQKKMERTKKKHSQKKKLYSQNNINETSSTQNILSFDNIIKPINTPSISTSISTPYTNNNLFIRDSIENNCFIPDSNGNNIHQYTNNLNIINNRDNRDNRDDRDDSLESDESESEDEKDFYSKRRKLLTPLNEELSCNYTKPLGNSIIIKDKKQDMLKNLNNNLFPKKLPSQDQFFNKSFNLNDNLNDNLKI